MSRCTRTLHLLLLLLAVLNIDSTFAQPTPEFYSCDAASNCKLPSCRCASTSPPAPSLSTTSSASSSIPQFVLITNDDGVTPKVASLMSQLTGNRTQTSTDCRIPATWFSLGNSSYSDCDIVRQRYIAGDEIAIHTVNHPKLFLSTNKDDFFPTEIVGAVNFFANTTNGCAIPRDQLVGFRSPYLVHNHEVRKVLHENGFLYDSSIHAKTDNMTGGRIWPYTLDSGPANAGCFDPIKPSDESSRTAICQRNESWPGLWEIPMWFMQYKDEQYLMDVGERGGGQPDGNVFEVLKSVFDAAYESNRAPVPIFVHEPWFEVEERVSQASAFIDYALNKTGVYFVTMRLLVDWMKNPVPVEEMDVWLQARCGSPKQQNVVALAPTAPAAAPATDQPAETSSSTSNPVDASNTSTSASNRINTYSLALLLVVFCFFA